MKKAFDTVTDALEKVQTPASRVGHVMERAAKLVRGEVDPEVVAMQMTKNSPNGHVYTPQGVVEMANAFEDCETRAILTAKQTTALLDDQAQVNASAGDGSLTPQPA